MNIDRHFHRVVTITHNCVIIATTVNPATSVCASHSLCLGAAAGAICVVFVYWLTGCLFVCAYCMCIWYGQDVSNREY